MKVFSLIFPPQASQADSWDKSELVFFSLNHWSQQWSAHLLRLPALPAWPAQPAENVFYIFCVLIVSYPGPCQQRKTAGRFVGRPRQCRGSGSLFGSGIPGGPECYTSHTCERCKDTAHWGGLHRTCSMALKVLAR